MNYKAIVVGKRLEQRGKPKTEQAAMLFEKQDTAVRKKDRESGNGNSAGPQRRDFLWNTAGSLVYALSSMLLAFFALRLCGADEGGIFGFGFSTFGQQMFIVSYFGIRPFHITDVQREYSFGDYRALRRVTSLTALALSALWVLTMTAACLYTPHKAAVVFLLAAYKVCDGMGDVYESELQREGLLYRSGRLLFVRTVFSAGTLLLGMAISRNLLMSCAGALLVQLMCLFWYKTVSFPDAKEENQTKARQTGAAPLALARSTVLLFVSVFLDFFVFSAAKYAVDFRLSAAESGIFNLLFMPTNVIYLAANFVMKPYMTYLSADVEKRDFEGFRRRTGRLRHLILGLILAAVVLAAVFGRPMLILLEVLLGSSYAGKLSSENCVFTAIIFGGGLYALANLFYYELVILRSQRLIFAVYALGAAAAGFLAPLFTKVCGTAGAAAAYVLLMLFLCAGFFFCRTTALHRAEKNKRE